MRALSLLSLLAACSEYQIAGEKQPPGRSDTAESECPGGPGACDTDPPPDETGDSDPPSDSGAVTTDPDDCDLPSAATTSVEIVEACAGGGDSTVTDPYDLQIEYQYTSAASGSVVKPSIINLTDDDGDGVIGTSDIPDIVSTIYGANQLVALSGDYSGELFVRPGWMGAGGVATADVNGDGLVDICGFSPSGNVQCADVNGTMEWTSTTRTTNSYPEITICDLDQDGLPEVIGDNQIINGENGTTAFQISISGAYSEPICADIDQDGTAEIILGKNVYSHTGALEWTMGGTGISAMHVVVNADSDNNAEIFLASDKLYLYEDDGTLIHATPIPTTTPGPPCAADFDGDGEVEVAVPSGTYFYMYDTDGTELWRAAMQDYSGLAGCSGYDMDGDGIYEVLFADEIALRLYDGATGAVLYQSFAHNSGTLFEYPVIADVDADGSAEIVVAENLGSLMGLTVYGHGGDGWPAAGPTWPVHDFAVSNIDADGTVPTTPTASWLEYNVFRARPAVDDPEMPDLTGAILGVCAADCDNGPVKVSVQVQNQGAEVIAAGAAWAFYKVDGGVRTLVTTGTLPELPAGTALDSFEIEVLPTDIGSEGFVIVLGDSGSGMDATSECDDTNNELAWTDPVCP